MKIASRLRIKFENTKRVEDIIILLTPYHLYNASRQSSTCRLALFNQRKLGCDNSAFHQLRQVYRNH